MHTAARPGHSIVTNAAIKRAYRDAARAIA